MLSRKLLLRSGKDKKQIQLSELYLPPDKHQEMCFHSHVNILTMSHRKKKLILTQATAENLYEQHEVGSVCSKPRKG